VTEFRATYRLMFGPGFGFAEARALVPYLRDLGVSHLYLPPSFQARAGSTHGYDVIDPTRISEELGGEDEFHALANSAHEAGLGIVLDIVPNHMAVDDANRWWADESLRPKFFDIDPRTGRHRRFFDIDHLAGVRQEDPEVFDTTHALALELVHDEVVHGLRIDHPDGLADPAGYLRRLRDAGVEHAWVEKILDSGERLRDWPVDGTVGYEFLNDVAALFVDASGLAALDALWEEIAEDPRPFAEHAFAAKLEQAAGVFAPDLEWLAGELGREISIEALARAVSSLPVYRTYVEPWSQLVTDADRTAIGEAGMDPALARILLLEDPAPAEFVTRFQQTTPPVMAKGVEDTAFYRYARLVALNEVGGDPSRIGMSVADFHSANAERLARFPRNLLVTSTHDTKRSADVRARVGALAGMGDEWAAHVRRWFSLNEPLRHGDAPDPVEEYFIYQNLVGAWPIGPERLCAFVEKALREGKRNSSWAAPDEHHEERVKAFCRDLYEHAPFRESFEPFAARVADAGERAALGQLLIKLTAPGVPDIYNGDEIVSLALVDPDNRRPVDWDLRRRLLEGVRAGTALDSADARKLRVVVAALELRRRRADAFAGSYEPLDLGERAIGYVRGGSVVVLAELFAGGADAVLELPAGEWRSVLNWGGEGAAGRMRLADLLDSSGIALLERLPGP
jgi:(1->4)-alpha-D-glucan 1-alpha-D-glucosylmutase